MGKKQRTRQRRRTSTRPAPRVDAVTGHERAVAALRRGDLDGAEHESRRVLRTCPDHAPSLNLLGVVLGSRRDLDAAVAHMERAIALDGDVAEYHHNLGIALGERGDFDDAAAEFERALELDPTYTAALRTLADMQRTRGASELARVDLLDTSVAAYRQLLVRDPDDVHALLGLGLALQEQGRTRPAELALARVTELDPAQHVAWTARGLALRLLGRFDESVECFTRATELWDDPRALGNVALTLADRGSFDEAIAMYREALRRAPDDPQVHFNYAAALLMAGRLPDAWDEFEYGLASGQRRPNRTLPAPRWNGEDISDKTILLWREQGIGDELLCASMFEEVVARAGRVIIECSIRLIPLFQRTFPTAIVREETLSMADGIEQVDPPDYDVQIPFYSLPRLLRPTLDAFPRDRGAYLTPDPAAVARWRTRLDALGDGPKVGMSWRSRNRHGDRAWYYTKLHQWGPLFATPDVHWVLLQYDDCEAEVVEAEERFGVTIHRWPDIDLMVDLDDVAALTSALDLAIGPATSVAHMCGALGIETWQLSIEHNSTALGAADRYPWMPSNRLFRRRADESWESVIDAVARELRAFTTGARAA